MKTITKKIADLHNEESPLPLSVIPNYMGINLSSVDSVSWMKQDDGQLISLTIHFIPDPLEKSTVPPVPVPVRGGSGGTMTVGQMRRLLAGYTDECELCVEMLIPIVPEKKLMDKWHVHGREPGTSFVRGEVVPNEYTRCGSSCGDHQYDVAIIEVVFGHFDVEVRRK